MKKIAPEVCHANFVAPRERIRRELLRHCDVHTLLRLPTGIWYSTGVKANVLFFDKLGPRDGPYTRDLWIYDLRSSGRFSLRNRQIMMDDLADFVEQYHPNDRTARKETNRFRRFSYEEIVNSDKASMDIQWSIEEVPSGDTETADSLMREIIRDLEQAIRSFSDVEKQMNRR
jgi:type I restriction enzyme M protein